MTESGATPDHAPARGRFTPTATDLDHWSPPGCQGTALAVFVFCFSSIALIAELTGRPCPGYVDAGVSRFQSFETFADRIIHGGVF